MISVDVKQDRNSLRVQELCESRGGRLGLFPLSPVVLMISVDVKQDRNIASEFRSCVKVEVDVLDSFPCPQ